MGFDKGVWKSKHAFRTQIRDKKSLSKHKSDENLATKHPHLPLFRIHQVAMWQNGEDLEV